MSGIHIHVVYNEKCFTEGGADDVTIYDSATKGVIMKSLTLEAITAL